MPHRDREIALLRQEVEMLISERELLLKVAGSAAVLIAGLDSTRLPLSAVAAADLLSTTVNQLQQETLQDALAAVNAKIEQDNPPARLHENTRNLR